MHVINHKTRVHYANTIHFDCGFLMHERSQHDHASEVMQGSSVFIYSLLRGEKQTFS